MKTYLAVRRPRDGYFHTMRDQICFVEAPTRREAILEAKRKFASINFSPVAYCKIVELVEVNPSAEAMFL